MIKHPATVNCASRGIARLWTRVFSNIEPSWVAKASVWDMPFSAQPLSDLLMETSSYLGQQRDMSLISELTIWLSFLFSHLSMGQELLSAQYSV